MSNFKKCEDGKMPTDILVLVKFEFGPYCLRSLTDDGELYDENNTLDDSEMTPVSWCYIPE